MCCGCVRTTCVSRLADAHAGADFGTLYANWRIKENSPRHVILEDLGNLCFVQHRNVVAVDDSTHLPRDWIQTQCPFTLCPMFVDYARCCYFYNCVLLAPLRQCLLLKRDRLRFLTPHGCKYAEWDLSPTRARYRWGAVKQKPRACRGFWDHVTCGFSADAVVVSPATRMWRAA